MIVNIFYNTPFLTMITVILILMLVIGIIRQIILFKIGLNKYTMINNVHDGKQSVKVLYKYIPQSTYGHVASYSVWLYINKFEYEIDKAKHIFHIGPEDKSIVSPGVWFYPKKNNLAIKFSIENKEQRFTDGKVGKAAKNKKCLFPYKIDWKKLQISPPRKLNSDMQIFNCETTRDKYSPGGYCPIKLNPKGYIDNILNFGSCGVKSMDPNINKTLLNTNSLCDIENVPLSRWFHLVITVKDNTVEVYLDGKLIKTCSSKNVPIISKGNLYVTNFDGFDGMLTKFKIFPVFLSSKDVEKIFMRGPNNRNNLIDFSIDLIK
jgi:hypothetical protein